MPRINIKMNLKGPEENINKELIGEKNDNKISFVDQGFNIDITCLEKKIILNKKNNEYNIELSLEKNNSFCIYEDIRSGMELKLKISDEIFTSDDNYVSMQYVVEDLNKIEYQLFFEVLDEGKD